MLGFGRRDWSVRRSVAHCLCALAWRRGNAPSLVRAFVGIVANPLLRARRPQHRARHDRRLAVDEVRDDLDEAHLEVGLALEDGSDRVRHVEVAVVGVLELLDAERGRLLRAEVVGLVALLYVAPDRLERVVQLHGHGEPALFERCQCLESVVAVGIFLGQRLDHDGQSHACARHCHREGKVQLVESREGAQALGAGARRSCLAEPWKQKVPKPCRASAEPWPTVHRARNRL